MAKTDFFETTYGSKLYGTSTATSDTDNKVVYIPELSSLLLGKKLHIFKKRFDSEGNALADNLPMPASGVETEYFPLHTFVRDFVNGQTYALEVAWAVMAEKRNNHSPLETPSYSAQSFIYELVAKFSNSNVYSMVGFAMKQTFDYVRRGERLNDALKVLKAIDDVEELLVQHGWSQRVNQEVRLDDAMLGTGEVVFDALVRLSGLPTATTINNNRTLRTIELNGRSYTETSSLEMFRNTVMKLKNSYGERSISAALTAVEYKSLSHAIRVYQQAIELLDTGKITFPRPNAAFLLSVKQGNEDMESITQLLRDLDDEVKLKMESSPLRKCTPELQQEAEDWLLSKLTKLYGVSLD